MIDEMRAMPFDKIARSFNWPCPDENSTMWYPECGRSRCRNLGRYDL